MFRIRENDIKVMEGLREKTEIAVENAGTPPGCDEGNFVVTLGSCLVAFQTVKESEVDGLVRMEIAPIYDPSEGSMSTVMDKKDMMKLAKILMSYT